MAARKTKDTDSVQALEKELEQLRVRLIKAREDREKKSETLVTKLQRDLEAGRKKERSARDKLAVVRGKKKTPAQQRQLEAARVTLADARSRVQAIQLETMEAQNAYRDFKADNKRAAEQAKLIAKQSLAYDKKLKAATKAKTRKAKTKTKRKTG
jgi:colicin import membrane protein